ncbi:hypothetical protein SFUMM280S_00664 [Streptomyces fumanus]
MTTGPNPCGVATFIASAYDSDASETVSSATNPNPISTPGSGARSPIATAASTSSTAWKTNTVASRSTRPSSSASRLTGVTRIRSTTPCPFSRMIMNPANEAPNSPSCSSSPGTSTCQELPRPPSGRPVSSGPKKSRYSSGISTPNSSANRERSDWRR